MWAYNRRIERKNNKFLGRLAQSVEQYSHKVQVGDSSSSSPTTILSPIWGVSSTGRAFPLHGKGWGFESPTLLETKVFLFFKNKMAESIRYGIIGSFKKEKVMDSTECLGCGDVGDGCTCPKKYYIVIGVDYDETWTEGLFSYESKAHEHAEALVIISAEECSSREYFVEEIELTK